MIEHHLGQFLVGPIEELLPDRKMPRGSRVPALHGGEHGPRSPDHLRRVLFQLARQRPVERQTAPLLASEGRLEVDDQVHSRRLSQPPKCREARTLAAGFVRGDRGLGRPGEIGEFRLRQTRAPSKSTNGIHATNISDRIFLVCGTGV